MSDSITGEFSIKGAPDTFVSTMLFLFGGRDDLTVSPDNDQQHVVKITPNGPQPYYQWCRFEAFALQDGPTQIRYFTPNKSDMESTIGEVIATLHRRGFIVDNSPVATSEIPKSDDAAPDQAGEPPRPGRRESRAHERARERLRSGEDETTVKADWCKDYEEETGMTPAQTTSGEKELWRNVKRAVKIGR